MWTGLPLSPGDWKPEGVEAPGINKARLQRPGAFFVRQLIIYRWLSWWRPEEMRRITWGPVQHSRDWLFSPFSTGIWPQPCPLPMPEAACRGSILTIAKGTYSRNHHGTWSTHLINGGDHTVTSAGNVSVWTWSKTFYLFILFLKLFKKDFIYLFFERGEGGEKERERNINV